MIYLHRYTADDVQIAVCEDDRRIAWYEAQGFTRCTLEAFRQAWQRRDAQRRAELAEADAQAEHSNVAP